MDYKLIDNVACSNRVSLFRHVCELRYLSIGFGRCMPATLLHVPAQETGVRLYGSLLCSMWLALSIPRFYLLLSR